MTDSTTSNRTRTTPVVPQQRRASIAPAGRPTPAERAAAGKAARHRLPLDANAEVRADPADVMGILARDEEGRVPELLPVRHGRMVASPFAFYRGAAAVMAADLAALPDSGLSAQLCGDAHLSNFGVFATPERRLIFDVNDFDETLPGPFEWDVKRLAASIALAGRANGHTRRDREKALLATVQTYRETMRRFAKLGNLAVWYASLDVDVALAELGPQLRSSDRRRSQAQLERARTKDNADALRKLTRNVDGRARFVHDPPLLVPLVELLPQNEARAWWDELMGILESYRDTLAEDRRHLLDEYDLVDIARKVVGVGSVGTRAWVLLLVGRDDGDPLVLQAKEARRSVLEPYCGSSVYDNSGQRVVAGQRLVQAASDIFLGWERHAGLDGVRRDFYVRQLRDGKASADIEDMNARRLGVYGQLCSWTLARAHARSGDRVAIASYLGKRDTFERAVTQFAEAYADRAEGQHRLLEDAVDSAAVEVMLGV